MRIAAERIYFQRFDLPGRGSQKEISYPHGHCQRIFVAPTCFLHVSLYVFSSLEALTNGGRVGKDWLPGSSMALESKSHGICALGRFGILFIAVSEF